MGPGAGTRYATDAYPGFDSEDEMVKPSRKEPRLFGWLNGPKKDNASEQLVYCRELLEEESYSKAAKHLDALVREWPTSTEAPEAQMLLAETLFEKLDDLDEAFSEFRYLLDFYSLQCDYNAIADKLYQTAGRMRAEGKSILFFRFRNTVDVRRAFECCVLRAPGAPWTPDAMLTIAELRDGVTLIPTFALTNAPTADAVAGGTVSGTIESNYCMNTVRVEVRSGDAVVAEAAAYPYDTKFLLSKLDDQLNIAGLPAGQYTLAVIAEVGLGTETLVELTFAK
jgi:hypothetical protein